MPLDKSPKAWLRAPMVPADAEVTNPGSCQHSSIDFPLRVAIAVTFRVGAVILETTDGGHVICADARMEKTCSMKHVSIRILMQLSDSDSHFWQVVESSRRKSVLEIARTNVGVTLTRFFSSIISPGIIYLYDGVSMCYNTLV